MSLACKVSQRNRFFFFNANSPHSAARTLICGQFEAAQVVCSATCVPGMYPECDKVPRTCHVRRTAWGGGGGKGGWSFQHSPGTNRVVMFPYMFGHMRGKKKKKEKEQEKKTGSLKSSKCLCNEVRNFDWRADFSSPPPASLSGRGLYKNDGPAELILRSEIL